MGVNKQGHATGRTRAPFSGVKVFSATMFQVVPGLPVATARPRSSTTRTGKSISMRSSTRTVNAGSTQGS
jgi:hypothetical protein